MLENTEGPIKNGQSSVPYVASFSALPVFDWPFGIV
jgi:hypothetical protein